MARPHRRSFLLGAECVRSRLGAGTMRTKIACEAAKRLLVAGAHVHLQYCQAIAVRYDQMCGWKDRALPFLAGRTRTIAAAPPASTLMALTTRAASGLVVVVTPLALRNSVLHVIAYDLQYCKT